MERPSKLSGEQGAYIEYLEKKLEVFSSKKTAVKSYLALKQIIDDTTDLVFEGIDVLNPETREMVNTPIISDMSLTNKDDKSFDRIFKVIDKLGEYNKDLQKMEETISPKEIEDVQKEIMKGEGSVEQRIFGTKD